MKCKECKYYNDIIEYDLGGGESEGECRRYPPNQPKDEDGFSTWPWTISEEWCGEFASA
jgi:hypothetical protein